VISPLGLLLFRSSTLWSWETWTRSFFRLPRSSQPARKSGLDWLPPFNRSRWKNHQLVSAFSHTTRRHLG